MMTYTELQSAEARALRLFDACLERGLVVPGKSERELNDEVFTLARDEFGVRRYWHKRIVRAGRNTLLPYAENPPNLVIQDDDLVFFDFGPVFEDWEADVGRSYVVGSDPLKHALVNDVSEAWNSGAALYRSNPDLTASELYEHVCTLAIHKGWEFGHIHSGHLVGRFPHVHVEDDDTKSYIRGDNQRRLRSVGTSGAPLYWILEIHFVDRSTGVGAFYEGLLPES